MSKVKILIVEDELIIAEDMKEILQELGYDVIGTACDSNEAKEILNNYEPDIALLDIQLRDGDNGINLAHYIRKNFNFPIIFITSYSDKATIERAKEVHPNGYIIKPFEKGDIFSSIEIAMSNFFSQTNNKPTDSEENSYLFKEYLFVKKKFQFEKVRIQDIQWIQSEGNYLEMFCGNEKKYLIRSTFQELFENISLKTFLQVHRSYAVNFEYIDSIRTNEIVVGKVKIPIGKVYQESIRKQLKIKF